MICRSGNIIRNDFICHGKGSLMPTRGLSRLAIAFVLAIFLPGCSNNIATRNAYVTLPTINQILAYRVNNKNGQLMRVFGGTFNAGMSPSSVVVHPSTHFVYVANSGENDISLYNVDSSSGTLREVLPRTTTALNPVSLAMDPSGNFLYVVNRGINGVSSYAIDASKGTLTAVAGTPVAAGFSPSNAAVTPSGKFLYVPNTNSNSVSAYAIINGGLQPVLGSPFLIGNGPQAIAIDPAEHFVYITNTSDSTISVLSIDSTTGALTNIVGSPFQVVQINNTGAATGPVSLAIHPSGTLLYIANQISGDLTFYALTANGTPIETTNSPYASGHGTSYVVAESTGNFIYVVNQSNHTISVYGVNTTDGTLTLQTLVSTGQGATQMVISN
jgi:6-phosphogluconolactonase (cycloisomerase 2 family)